MTAVIQHVAIGLLDRVGDQAVAYDPPVDEKVLQVGLAARKRRQPHPAPQAEGCDVDIDLQGLLHEGRTADRRHAAALFRLGRRRRQRVHRAAVMPQGKRHVKTRQRQPLEDFFKVIEFGFFGTQELASRRRVKKEVAHLHGGAAGMRRRLHLHVHIAAFTHGRVAGTAAGLVVAGQRQARHRTDTGERLAAKPQAGDPFQILQRSNLAGRVTRQRERQVVCRHSAAIVTYADQLGPATLHVHLNPRGAGIERVLQDFLDHRRRALNHLACGNLVGQPGIQQMYLGHVGRRLARLRVVSFSESSASARS